jgi:hypothetical protein
MPLGLALGAILVVVIEAAASLGGELYARWRPVLYPEKPPLASALAAAQATPVVRIVASAAVGAVLIGLLHSRKTGQSVLAISFYALCTVLALHCIVLADTKINGAETRSPIAPFDRGNMYVASRNEFVLPSSEEVKGLQRAIENDHYRSVLICNTKFASGFCAGHVPEFWKIRTIDGYYGIGVPKRIAVFPWPSGISLRAIYFTSHDQLPWRLLALANVKYALVVNDYIYRHTADRVLLSQMPGPVEVIANPFDAVPRAYFANAVEGVSTPEEAAGRLARQEDAPAPVRVTYVEGILGRHEFVSSGHIELSGQGDELHVKVDSSPHRRFLVVNELFSPGWEVFLNGERGMIYPANSFMRGVIVPPGITNITFRYTPFVKRPIAYGLYGLGILLLVAGHRLMRGLVNRVLKNPPNDDYDGM